MTKTRRRWMKTSTELWDTTGPAQSAVRMIRSAFTRSAAGSESVTDMFVIADWIV